MRRRGWLAILVVSVVLVGWPVVAGFWMTSPLELAMSQHPGARIVTVHCLDVACDMTYTKSCGGAADIDPHTGVTRHSSYSCEIRDKHGKVVRTYTTDALRPTP